MSDPVHDPVHDTVGDTVGDRLRLLGTQLPAPALPAEEIRRRADRRRHRRHLRHALGATAACTAAALFLALPSAPHPAGPQQGAVATPASSGSTSPSPR
ncbi:hypothetical protein ABTY61_41865, partial [Kitasatospora sp. NPDC096128]